jgi:uncharacterized protein (DUF1697 family)
VEETMSTSYVALLRAVNVAGKTLKMEDLRQVASSLGHTDVSTYIQSGNVVFKCPRTNPAKLARQIEERLARDLALETTVLIRSHQNLAEIAANNPFLRQGHDPSKLHMTFLATQPTAEAAVRLTLPAGEPEEFSLQGHDVYLYYPNGYGRSKVSNAYIERRLGVPATTRNWATLLKLRDLSAPAP